MAGITKWTAAETETLRRMWDEGLSASQISAALSGRFSRCAVIAKADRLALPGRDSSVNRGYAFRKPKVAPKPSGPSSEPTAALSEPAPIGPWGESSGRRTCQWIHGDVQVEWRMCGHPAVAFRPYCAAHAAKSYATTKHPVTASRGGR